MNRPETPSRLMPIPDVQAGRDERRLAIDRVGIKGLRYPLPFVDGDDVVHTTIATCDVYVALPEEQKGTHMSRLVALLEQHATPGAAPLSVARLRGFVEELTARLHAPGGRLEIAFPFFVRKIAPVSGVASLLDYDVRLTAELADGVFASTVGVSVPVTSLCPCSKEISDYGAHNQRSLVTIVVRPRGPILVSELLRVAEEEASCELYGILKRADEKYVTERAYDNPRFVEDLVRGVASRLDADERFSAYTVEAENFESIHNHSAYARIARGW
ncbi:MAG TPA: GTP cyclohydrolase FolE2 [Casimicrobiaceae bacterium]